MTSTAQDLVTPNGGRRTIPRRGDLRGLRVLDVDGEVLGRIDDVLVDGDAVRILIVASAGFLGLGAQRSPLPVDAVTGLTDNQVCVAETRERVIAAPAYQSDLVDDRNYRERIFAHYGYPPQRADGPRPRVRTNRLPGDRYAHLFSR